MLIEATIKNFRSIKEQVVFSMLASNEADMAETKTFSIDDKRALLKNALIYGPNGSGKSNLLKALLFMKRFILTSGKMSSSDKINVEPFYFDSNSKNEPSMFEVVFFKEKFKYRYGFEVTNEKVISEWLFVDYSIRETKIFVRNEQDISIGGRSDIPKKAIKITRDNGLLLAVSDQLNSKIAQEVFEWFKKLNVLPNLSSNHIEITAALLNSKEENPLKQIIKETILKADIGIVSTEIKENTYTYKELSEKKNIPEPILNYFMNEEIINSQDTITEYEIYMNHNIFDENNILLGNKKIELEQESKGTQRLFALLGPLFNAIFNNGVLFIDEFDNGLHPLLLEKILELTSSKLFMNLKYQIIFVTHYTPFLNFSKIRKDQIWFTDKAEFGNTRLTALLEYKSVRKDINVEKTYLNGIFGAVPAIENICGEKYGL